MSADTMPAHEVSRMKNVIGNEWVEAADGGVDTVVNPATGRAIAQVPCGTEADVGRAVEAAKAAVGDWVETTPQERSLILLQLADGLEAHVDELASLESQNVGKPLPMARDEVLSWAVDVLRFFAGAARCLEGRAASEYVRGYTSIIRREPIGVTGQITPWNYPLLEALMLVGPSLAAGNVCICKPAEETPLTTLKLAEIASDLLPPGVLNVITGEGTTVGAEIVRHPDIRMVSLVGDVATGRQIARDAAASLKRVHLELGGKAPVVVFDDADLEAATEAIKVAGYFNSGQECTAASRVIAGPTIYDRLIERLVPAVESIRVGDPSGPSEIDMGPMVSERQRDRVLGFLERAERATVLTGGDTIGSEGCFIRPTLLTDVQQDDEIVQREVFGPVVTVQRAEDDAQMLAWANDVEYGLAASVWTSDLDRATRFMRKLEFGTVWVNDHFLVVAEMPHGGYKQSGYGRDLSIYSVEEYTQLKHVMIKAGKE